MERQDGRDTYIKSLWRATDVCLSIEEENPPLSYNIRPERCKPQDDTSLFLFLIYLFFIFVSVHSCGNAKNGHLFFSLHPNVRWIVLIHTKLSCICSTALFFFLNNGVERQYRFIFNYITSGSCIIRSHVMSRTFRRNLFEVKCIL